jgi:hypothetical protein
MVSRDLKLAAAVIFELGLGSVPYVKELCPSIIDRLEVLGAWQDREREAGRYLLKVSAGVNLSQLAAYHEFTRFCYFTIHKYGLQGAIPYVEAERDLFVSYGLSERILNELALLQGLTI